MSSDHGPTDVADAGAQDPKVRVTPRRLVDRRSRKDLDQLASLMRKHLWSLPFRDALNEIGLHLVPANFYSAIPSAGEVRSSFEYGADEIPWLDCDFIDQATMGSYLQTLLPCTDQFNPPDEGDLHRPAGFFWNNPAFSFTDAMAYYAMVRHLRPNRIVEVGSGFSTLVASRAIADNGGGGQITCIDPFPRPFLKKVPHVSAIIQTNVQQVPVAFFAEQLADGDILFIDSTHTVKTGSDCVYLYLRVLPRLEQQLMLHAHDIFLPESYPQAWILEKHIYWTEQYLLQALLTQNPNYQVVFGSNYHRLVNGPLLDRFMHGRAQSGGGSFWFRRL